MNLPGSYKSAARWSLSQSNGSKLCFDFEFKRYDMVCRGSPAQEVFSAGKVKTLVIGKRVLGPAFGKRQIIGRN